MSVATTENYTRYTLQSVRIEIIQELDSSRRGTPPWILYEFHGIGQSSELGNDGHPDLM
jgi:hypothetical protein